MAEASKPKTEKVIVKKASPKKVEPKKSRLEEMQEEYFEFKKSCRKGEQDVLFIAYILEKALNGRSKK